MEMASIIHQYYPEFIARYGQTALPGHLKALDAICRCRTPDSGELYLLCPDCGHAQWRPLSCGHRSCPQCQNHEADRWIDRQQAKLLPVPYFTRDLQVMVTFTLPCELRSLAWHHQKMVYCALFSCVSGTLKDFGLNKKNLGTEIGTTMVLHTNNRKLDCHPHIHAVVPGGGVDKQRRQWKKKKSKYLFNHKALAKVFRARFLTALNEAGFSVSPGIIKEWVVDCAYVGKEISIVDPIVKTVFQYYRIFSLIS